MSGANLGSDVDAEPVSLSDVQAPIVGDTRLVRRQRITVVIALVCAVVSIGGLVASRFVRSPQQQAASVGAPTPSVLTAPVVRQVLNRTLATRGTVAAAREVQVAPGAPGGQGASVAVVTAVRVGVGQAVSAGQVLVEVSGRPVIALPGDVPAYRDLKPGDTGKDITELQQALAARGLYRESASGTFRPGHQGRRPHALPRTGLRRADHRRPRRRG